MSILVVRDLSKAYGGVQAVRGVSFTLAAGELLASGAIKPGAILDR